MTSLPTISFLRESEDGPCWSLIWDVDEIHMEVGLYPDGKCDWFYKNRKTGRFEGTEDKLEDFPPTRFCELIPLFDVSGR